MPLGTSNVGLTESQKDEICPKDTNVMFKGKKCSEYIKKHDAGSLVRRLRDIVFDELGEQDTGGGNYFDDIRAAERKVQGQLDDVESAADAAFDELSKSGDAKLKPCQQVDEYKRLRRTLQDEIQQLPSIKTITDAYAGIARNAKTKNIEDKVKNLLDDIAPLTSQECTGEFYTSGGRKDMCTISGSEGFKLSCCCFKPALTFKTAEKLSCPVKFESGGQTEESKANSDSLSLTDKFKPFERDDNCEKFSDASTFSAVSKGKCRWRNTFHDETNKDGKKCTWYVPSQENRKCKCFFPNQGTMYDEPGNEITDKVKLCYELSDDKDAAMVDYSVLRSKCKDQCGTGAGYAGNVFAVPVGTPGLNPNWQYTSGEFCTSHAGADIHESDKCDMSTNWAHALLVAMHNRATWKEGDGVKPSNALADIQNIGDRIKKQQEPYIKQTQEDLEEFLYNARKMTRKKVTEFLLEAKKKLAEDMNNVEALLEARTALDHIQNAADQLTAAVKNATQGMQNFVDNKCSAQLTRPSPRKAGYDNPAPVCALGADARAAGDIFSCCCFGTAYSLAAPLGNECPVDVSLWAINAAVPYAPSVVLTMLCAMLARW